MQPVLRGHLAADANAMARSGFGQGRATTLMMIIPLNVLFMGREVDLLQHRERIAAPRGDYR